MFCEHCGNKIEENAQFCQSCGKKTSRAAQVTSPTVASSNPTEGKSETIVKCGNCDYVGPGQSARTVGGRIIAWLCVLFAPLITIIYFVVTYKYRCPKCKSTFLGVKNKDGIFVGQRGGAKSPIMIFVLVLLGIVVIGILATLATVSLNAARSKARDAKRVSDLKQMATAMELWSADMNKYVGGCGTVAQEKTKQLTSACSNNSYITWAEIKDPTSPTNVYEIGSTAISDTTYKFCATFENKDDSISTTGLPGVACITQDGWQAGYTAE